MGVRRSTANRYTYEEVMVLVDQLDLHRALERPSADRHVILELLMSLADLMLQGHLCARGFALTPRTWAKPSNTPRGLYIPRRPPL